jgi:hypothetical protein
MELAAIMSEFVEQTVNEIDARVSGKVRLNVPLTRRY